MQIKKRFLLVMISLICIPLLILTVVIYIYSSNNLMIKSQNVLKQLVISKGKTLEALFHSTMHRNQMLAQDRLIIQVLTKGTLNSSEEINQVRELLIQACKDENSDEILLIDSEGKVLVSSYKKNEQLVLSYQEIYRGLSEGKTIMTELFSGDREKDRSISIIVPVIDDRDEVVGSICEVVSINWLRELTQNIELEETSYTYILNEKLNFILHSKKSKEGTILESTGIKNLIEAAYQKGETYGIGISTHEGAEKYVAFYRVKNSDWIVCIEQNIGEIRQQAVVEVLIIMGCLMLMAISIGVFCVRFSRKITKPMEELITSMNQVSNGDFMQISSYNRDDEFGILFLRYNHMIKKLGDSHQEFNYVCEELSVTQDKLKRKVKELTQNREALAISEKRYKITLDAIEEVIWEYNIRTKSFFATEKWEELTGYSNQDIKVIAVIKEILEPYSIEAFILTLKSCIEGNIDSFNQQIHIKNKRGEYKWLLCKGHTVRNAQGKISKLIGALSDITLCKENEERVRKLAFFDVLTGCLNKQTFMESLETWLSPKEEVKDAALLFIDLDDFKKINDTLGHEVGDKLLNYAAKVLRYIIPQDSFISRFGGDEFVIFKTKIFDISEVQEMVYAILNIFQDPIHIDGKDIHITCSIGIALYPLDGISADVLLKNADTAMYKAKELGKNTYSFYAPDMSKSLDRKLMIEGALREAISKNTLYIQYQPIVDIKTQKTVAVEALLRLKDNELGFISPGEFIPIAEEAGLIISAGDWVIEKALTELNYYRLQGYENLSITINVSSLQMKDRSFLEKLKVTVKNTKVPPELIKLEVTESVLMENVEKSIELFHEIKGIGIKLALDDFGTGYSSLNYLRSIPLDILKIDKSFIDEITVSSVQSEIVDSIIGMAHTLNILVVAEGVETEEQFKILRDKGCDLVQGYFFSKPLMPNQLGERLEEEKYV